MILNVNLVLSCLCFGTFDKAGFPAIAGKVASLPGLGVAISV